MKKILVAVIMVMGILTVTNAFAVTLGSVFQWSSGDGYNNHYYQAAAYTQGDTVDWNAAEAYAVSLGGHLASITSRDERNWVWDNARINSSTSPSYYFLGGYQIYTSDEYYSHYGHTHNNRATGWSWVTGESWSSYTTWEDGEPNDAGNTSELTPGDTSYEDYLQYWDNHHWNDTAGNNASGYIMEFNTNPTAAIPEPMSLSLLGLGLLGAMGAGFRKRK